VRKPALLAPIRSFCLPVLLVAVAAAVAARPARADTFLSDPSRGLSLPMTSLTGDADAMAVSVNPAGLAFLGGAHLEAAFTGLRDDRVDGTGAGVGVFAGTSVAIPFLPRIGVGLGVEKLLPPRAVLAPDPGEPLRLSLAWAYAWSPSVGVGLEWHHFVDPDSGGVLDGANTWDLGLSWRLGAHAAVGLVARDLFAPQVGGVPLERRYDAELVARPYTDDRLEIAAGAAIGERRGGFDPRLRLGVRLARGLYARAALEGRTLFRVADPTMPDGPTDRTWDARLSAGLEVSFGALGAAAYATGSYSPDDGSGFGGGTVIARWSEERLPSLTPRGEHIERVKIGSLDSERRLANLLNRLHRIEEDASARAVFLQIEGLSAGWATLEELRGAVQRLRARGKKVFAYLAAGSTRDYYLASAADKIYLDAAGGLRLVGLSSSILFFRQLFDKMGVVAQFEKIEEYKSAPEAFTMTHSSDKAREMRESILDDVYGRLVENLARDRGRSAAQVKKMFEDGPYTAAEAGRAGLVDEVVEPVQIDRLLAKELGGYLDVANEPVAERFESWAYPQIAVVLLEGDIIDGKSVEIPFVGQRMAGGETIGATIAWARANPRVAGIVLRVNSPGGSALASEVIAREVSATRGVKPIVVSMGDVAASGGYFSAAPGDVIFADPSTITGSIGIFTGKFDLSGLLGRLGLTWETSRRGPHADEESYLRPYTEEERVQIKDKLRYFYGRFVGTVAKGRAMTEAQVDAVGRGRVWTGAQAKERKLCDRFGGLVDAILEAKRRAGLGQSDRAEVIFLPLVSDSILATLLRLTGNGSASSQTGSAVDVLLPSVRAALRAIPGSLLVAPEGSVQARMPFELRME
jgi:protease IV